MQKTLIKISTSLLCFGSLINPAFANYGYDSSTSSAPPSTTVVESRQGPGPAPGGYYSSSAAQPSTTTSEYRHRHHDRSSLSVNIATNTVYPAPTYYSSHGGQHHPQQPFWIHMHSGEPVPVNAVIGGSHHHNNSLYYICRANYHGGTHPGKLSDGHCNISWGGRELVMQNYEVLISDMPLTWAESSNGMIPHHAIEGGYENHRKIYICQAEYENGTYPGKLIGNNCNFAFRGREMMTPYYNVLVR